MGRVPLLLLSADRPPELQDCGANQTIDQVRMFGGHVRAFHPLPPAETDGRWLGAFAARAVGEAMGPLPGPVHINIPLREPLVHGTTATAEAEVIPRVLAEGTPQVSLQAEAALNKLTAAGPGVVICGAENLGSAFAAALARLVRRLNVPVFADVLSSLRFRPTMLDLILAYPDAVARAALPRPSWVLRFGPMPVSRAIADLLSAWAGVPQAVVSAHARWPDPLRTATLALLAEPAAACDAVAGPAAPSDWPAPFLAVDGAAACRAESLCAGEPFEGGLARALIRALPKGTALFLGNSLAVRAADGFVGRVENDLVPFANRGASGIDGNLSTFFGIAAARKPAVAVVGDLAFLHDLNGLALGRRTGGVVVVLDNGGGGIFDHLPQADLPEFERGWLTPQVVDLEAAVRAFGLSYVRAGSVAEAVAAALAGLGHPVARVVHLPIDRAASRRTFLAFSRSTNS
jgi:2-succinyl-5-enolpyruvyl-6-hydroxy-3-cyclohexene-1-carboxylate synthase